MPYAKNLEDAVVPGPSTIVKAVKKALQGVRLWFFDDWCLHIMKKYELSLAVKIEKRLNCIAL